MMRSIANIRSGSSAGILRDPSLRRSSVRSAASLGLRAARGSWLALRDGPVVRGLALVAAITIVVLNV
jgi:hypothetical protein